MKLLFFTLCTSLAVAQSQKSQSISNTVVIRQGGSYLGVTFIDVPEGHRGIEIKFVEEGSPAAKAGIKPEDVIVDFNGQHVEGVPQFIRMVSECPAGRKVQLGVTRAGTPLTLTAILESRIAVHEIPMESPLPPVVVMPDLPRNNMLWRNGVLGIETESLNAQLAEYFGVKEGVLIRMVTNSLAAFRAGLKAGDVITKAAGKPIASAREISALLPGRKSLKLGIVRNHKELSVDVLLN